MDYDEFGQALVFGTTAGLILVAVLGPPLYFDKQDEKIKQIAFETSEQMTQKIAVDIREQNTIPLSDGYYIDLTHVNVSSAEGHLGETQNALNVYGTVDNEYSFKNVYDLSDEQHSYITEKMKTEEALKRLAEIFEELTLKEHSAADIKAVTLGFSEQEQLANLAKNMGPAIPTTNFNKYNQNKTPDAFIPVYSHFEIVQIDGKSYAQLKIEGVEVHTQNPLNPVGFFMPPKDFAGEAGFSANYAFGLSTAIANSIEKYSTYFRQEQVMMELNEEHALLLEEEIRDIMLSQLTSQENTLQFQAIAISKNMKNLENTKFVDIYEDKGMEQ